MEKEVYNITGVTAKKELQIGLLFGISFVILWGILFVGFQYIQNITDFKIITSFSFLCTMSIALSVSYFILKILGAKQREKFIFQLEKDHMEIHYHENTIFFDYTNIEEISLVGTANTMRYFKIKTKNRSLKIRLGTYHLAPFSEHNDILTIDIVMKSLVEKLTLLNFFNKKVVIPNKTFEHRIFRNNP
ncbi:hypothetical protein [Chryseobacterium sp.]|uniref:hypothetical protein n=1 Tax=Chryseobacterium sp. TaxID=1871047 RepID=UPI00388E4FFE